MKKTIFYCCIVSTILSSIIYLKVAALYHFLILAMFLFSFNKKENVLKKTNNNPILRFLFYWFMYAVISAFLSVDHKLSAQYSYYILLIYMYSALFIICINDKIKLIQTVRFFILITSVACGIGIWENFTGNHILKDYLDTLDRIRLMKYMPGFTYRNPNDFAMFLLQMLPYTFYGIIFEKKSFYKYLSVLNLVALLFVVAATESRTILITIIICSVIIGVKYLNKSFLKILLIGTIGIIIMRCVPELNKLLETALDSISRDNLTLSIETGGASGNVRIHTFLNCLLMLFHTGGFGVGAGCHRLYMYSYSENYFNTGHIRVAHNFIAEFLADYGIIMFVLMIYTFSASIKRMKAYYNHGQDEQLKNLSFLLMLSLWVFTLGSITVSSMIQAPSLWTTIGFIAAYINICEKEECGVKAAEGKHDRRF